MLNAVSIHKNPGAHWKFPFCPSEYSLLLQAMLDETEHTGMTVELALLDDAAMEHLNRASTGCAGPTNILAFPVPAATAGGRACLSPPYGGDKHARPPAVAAGT
ncbi:MAG: hypothetical protein LBD42_08790, partial [Desulfovibrio sp.]|nr:hypothetical protein [Desulfovibrio sp.]